MNRKPAALTLAIVLAIGAGLAGGTALQSAIRQPAQPVLVELFTSQGCSSCPPADALAEKLASEGNVVVVTRPVTYWDRLGWKDTLAREENTQLQRAYARRGLKEKNGVYTPQMVVDGNRGTVGSNAAMVRQMIGQEGDAAASIAVRPGPGKLAIGVAGTAERAAELVLMTLAPSKTVRIGSGENGGRAIRYTNVLTNERKLADWTGGALSLVTPASSDGRHALVLREADGGRVLASRLVQ